MNTQNLETYTQKKNCKIFSVQTIMGNHTQKEVHRHSFYQIVLLKKGSIKNFIDFEWKEAKAPFISVVFPNQVHRMILSDDAETNIIMFDQVVFCSALLANELREYNIDLQARINHVENVPLQSWEQILDLLALINAMPDDISMIQKMQIKFMIKIILLKIIDMAPNQHPVSNIDGDLQIYLNFREALNRCFHEQKKVQVYAEELGVTPKKLSTICYKYTGCTPLEIIHKRMNIELKRAFIEDGISLKQIAFQFSFSSQSALNKFIEREFGCTPQEWRKQLESNMIGKKL